MKESSNWGKAQSKGVSTGLIVRICLAVAATVGSVALAWTLLASHTVSHAAGLNEYNTQPFPWGIAFDTNGHVFVAEAGCEMPICNTPPIRGFISEYNVATGALITDFQEPATGYSSPAFLAIDGSGNVWFTEPNTPAIGELIPSGAGTWKHYTSGITPGSSPFDLAFDKHGNLWFTEYSANNIGFINTSTHVVVENAILTQGSTPYGITMDPSGNMWFAENALSATSGSGNIGSFTPTVSGTLTAGAISEHIVAGTHPHLITSDGGGNIWYSEGFLGNVGEWNVTTASDKQFNVSTGSCPPPSPTVTPTPCGNHISGIAVDSKGMVWFDDHLSNRVGVLNPAANGGSGTFTAIKVSTEPNDGLAIDSNGNTWFTEDYGNKLGEIPAGTVSTAPPGPVSKTWYFAEGRVGKGFSEFLTLGNPDPVNACAVNVQYMLSPDSGSPSTRTIQVTVNPGSRRTQSANTDLGVQTSQPSGVSISALVTVNAGATPNCNGIVAERPMYFNALGVSSGDVVVGATHTSSTFLFADVPTNSGYASFITILNPPGGTAATVTAKYYAPNGTLAGQQSVTVPSGSRGTIVPDGLHMPLHVSAIVTSTTPVVVERPDYFSNIKSGNAGTVSGAAVVVGAPTTAPDWLFAEGYTGGGFQERLVIANLDTTANKQATVTVQLDYRNGAPPQKFTLTLAALNQTIFDVNAHNTHGATTDVSAEVSSTGAQIVVERQMFFHFNLGNGQTAVGGNEVQGQPGPAAHSAYSFAEGYTNTNYSEWLTLQNPTATAETIWITVVNGLGRTKTLSVIVPANSRYTLNVFSDIVGKYMLQPGDNFHAYEVSMTVQTLNGAFFVAERPMYWNTGSTQGGHDAFGYTGG